MHDEREKTDFGDARGRLTNGSVCLCVRVPTCRCAKCAGVKGFCCQAHYRVMRHILNCLISVKDCSPKRNLHAVLKSRNRGENASLMQELKRVWVRGGVGGLVNSSSAGPSTVER